VLEHGDNTLSTHDPSAAGDRGDAATRMAHDTRIGPWLQSHRVARGFSVQDLSRKLKIQPRYLQALEADDFAALPGQPYVGGYVRSSPQFIRRQNL
jgi:ribosome-binding protein aMBF1 (putative translation factor)